jgi:hypothetical protein
VQSGEDKVELRISPNATAAWIGKSHGIPGFSHQNSCDLWMFIPSTGIYSYCPLSISLSWPVFWSFRSWKEWNFNTGFVFSWLQSQTSLAWKTDATQTFPKPYNDWIARESVRLNIEKNQIPWLKMLKTTFSPEKPAKNDGSIHHFWTCSFGPVRTETEVFHLAAEAQKVLPLKDFPSLSRDDRELNLDAGNVERCSWGTRTRNRKNLFFFLPILWLWSL